MTEGSAKEINSLSDIFKDNTETYSTLYKTVLGNSMNLNEYSHEETTRLFLLTTLYGEFEAKEILNNLRTDTYCPYPFLQHDLYVEKQPSLFMIDCDHVIYIWQGWYDSLSDENSKQQILSQMDATNGTTKIRYNIMRKCAYETAVSYWNEKYANDSRAFEGYVVYAGLEPQEFINLFPFWGINQNARNCNLNVSIWRIVSI